MRLDSNYITCFGLYVLKITLLILLISTLTGKSCAQRDKIRLLSRSLPDNDDNSETSTGAAVLQVHAGGPWGNSQPAGTPTVSAAAQLNTTITVW